MKRKPRGVVGVIRETFKSWSEDKAPRLAAALSYYTIFSLAPLLVLVIAIAGFVIGSNGTIRNEVITQVQSVVGAQGAQMVDTLITNTSKPRTGILATVIGIIALFFGATGVFSQLKDALNTIWEVAPKRNQGIGGMVRERLSGLVMILGLGFLLLVSLVISTVLTVINSYFTSLLGNTGIVPILVNYLVQLVVIALIFGAIFEWVPDVDIRFSDVWVGALVTGILFLVGQYLISLYLSKASPASAYGAAGSLVVLFLWVYYSAQILFLGAEFTRAYSLARHEAIAPNENARPLTAEERFHQGIARPEDEEAVRRGNVTAYPTVAPAAIPVSGEEQKREGQRADNQEGS